MPEYILLLHEDPAAFSGLSPTDIQAMIQRYKNWRESIAAKGHQAGGKKLRDAVGRADPRAHGLQLEDTADQAHGGRERIRVRSDGASQWPIAGIGRFRSGCAKIHAT